MQRYTGGLGSEQMRWLIRELEAARSSRRRLIVASHHCLARGACRETHRSWNGDEVATLLEDSGVVVLALAGHDHIGGFAMRGGVAYVTVEAMLEAPAAGNAYALVVVHADRLVIDGCGTSVTSRQLPLSA